jgi:cobalt-zinc-cadmium efflux system protein
MSIDDRHHAHTQQKLFGAILVNVIITAAEFVGGVVTGYLALTADAVHNLSDVAALILAWLGARGSQLPATKRSTYGPKRVEVFTALISAVSLVIIAVFIFRAAYLRLLTPQPIEYPWLYLGIAAVGLVGNVLSVWLLFSEKGKSLNMKAAFLHMIYDALASAAVIIGGIVILYTGWMPLDALLSTVIGVMILWSSYNVIHEATLILLEAVPAALDFDSVHDAIMSLPRIRDVHDLHIWSLSSKEVALSCHVCVNERDYPDGPGIIAEINALLRTKFAIGHATIQIERDDCLRSDLLCRYHLQE